MSSIQIISTPPGFAPESIRKQWVGVIIPMPTADEVAKDPPSGFKIGHENDGGYVVLTKQAIKSLLIAGKDEAAAFWRELPIGRFLEFRQDVCKVID